VIKVNRTTILSFTFTRWQLDFNAAASGFSEIKTFFGKLIGCVFVIIWDKMNNFLKIKK
jgi:hypothetical protein